jgi:hypothetical protein
MPQGNRFTMRRVLLFPVVFPPVGSFRHIPRLDKQPPQIIRRVSCLIPYGSRILNDPYAGINLLVLSPLPAKPNRVRKNRTIPPMTEAIPALSVIPRLNPAPAFVS